MSLLGLLGGSLARLLVRGFERILARTISRGISSDVLTGVILSREKSLGLEAARALAEFVVAGQRVAERIELGPAEEVVPLEHLPVNQYLFFQRETGDRVYVQGVVEIRDLEGNLLGTRTESLEGPELPSNGDVRSAMIDMALAKFRNTDPQGVALGEEGLRAEVVRLDLAQRKY